MSSGLFSLKCVKRLSNDLVLRNVYFANVQSHLLYSIATWYTLISEKIRKRLLIIYNKCMKILGGMGNKYKVYHPDQLAKIELAKLSHRYTNKILPKQISNLFDMKHHSYNTRSGNAPLTRVHGSKLYNDSFICKAPSSWRLLPQTIKHKGSLNLFVKNYKESLK